MKYSSVMVELPEPLASCLVSFTKNLFAEEDLVEVPRIPHVTIKGGVLSNDIEEIANAISPPLSIHIVLGSMGVFMADHTRESDVVKLELSSLGLVEMRQRIEQNLACQDTYENFYPHVTLGHVKPGLGLSYIQGHPLIGTEFGARSVLIYTATGEMARLYDCGELIKL